MGYVKSRNKGLRIQVKLILFLQLQHRYTNKYNISTESKTKIQFKLLNL